MNKTMLVISMYLLSACSIDKENNSKFEHKLPSCGTSQLDGQTIPKVCATQDFIAKKPHKKNRWFGFLSVEGVDNSGVSGSLDYQRISLDIKNLKLDMQNHFWDFKNQEASNMHIQTINNPSLIIDSRNSIIENGVILRPVQNNYGIGFGEENYIYKYFTNYTNDEDKFGNTKISTHIVINKMKIQTPSFYLFAKNGKIRQSTINLKNNIRIANSNNSFINKNHIISIGDAYCLRVYLEKYNKSMLIDYGKFDSDSNSYNNRCGIPNILLLTYSPDTIIDGNTFTLTHRNDQAYAIVLDHSPRVRITNNTFNGFKVPILMDQWSSIVDDKGNILNPDQFAGNVEMNRKGEIIKTRIARPWYEGWFSKHK